MATPYAAIYYELDKMTPHCVRKLRILRYWMIFYHQILYFEFLLC